ncbi:MAG: 2-C-methyl-D-erythritol 2,4-cyclodiphosphate synthase [Planctomycetota bacterium]|nr:MAG: 2-C-methyl-D-erythritol 2,4-cyclodiphosphate synthase [Planctomycetota bacterium]
MQQRVGLGFDIHRLEPCPDGGVVWLAGVAVPAPYQVIAHSDGDVVLHALCDALLGTVAAGDIGEHFPDTDATYAGAASDTLLAAVLALPALQGWRIINVDVNIIAQAPRLSEHKPALRRHLSHLLQLSPECVSIKARSHEGVDAIGEKRAISAQVIVLTQHDSAMPAAH